MCVFLVCDNLLRLSQGEERWEEAQCHLGYMHTTVPVTAPTILYADPLTASFFQTKKCKLRVCSSLLTVTFEQKKRVQAQTHTVRPRAPGTRPSLGAQSPSSRSRCLVQTKPLFSVIFKLISDPPFSSSPILELHLRMGGVAGPQGSALG